MGIKFSRREFVISSLGAIGALSFGCSPKSSVSSSPVMYRPADLPEAPWPEVNEGTRQLRSSRVVHEIPQQPTRTAKVERPTRKIQPVKRYDTLESVISRNQWARGGVAAGLVNPMNSINRITIHHEGSVPVLFNDRRQSLARVEQIRRFHSQNRGWADIGYHYIIDRGGRIWEGRLIKYQGAHVKNHNENNIGILVLGNFNKQNPSGEQLKRLPALVKDLRGKYKVNVNRVKTHQEWNPTSCPGKSLQAQINLMRRQRLFG